MPKITKKQINFILYETFGLTLMVGIIAIISVFSVKTPNPNDLYFWFIPWIFGLAVLLYQSTKIK